MFSTVTCGGRSSNPSVESQICLRVEINEEDGSALFDFEGTGCEVRGNLNAPVSVVHSAVIYCIRAMLNVDIPLNAGCLVPLDSKCFPVCMIFLAQFEVVRIPSGSFLAPSRIAAVCGGNVLTSQRIVDVVLRAFHACAASQGCTNNLTFGAGGKDSDGRAVPGWGYYEVRGCVYIYIPLRILNGRVDDCGRFWGRPKLAWNVGCPHTHHKHTDRRCRVT